jgi:hypothetical protein
VAVRPRPVSDRVATDEQERRPAKDAAAAVVGRGRSKDAVFLGEKDRGAGEVDELGLVFVQLLRGGEGIRIVG